MGLASVSAPVADTSSGSITTGGDSQTLVAALDGRKYLLVHNPSSANLGICLATSGAASIGAAGTITLEPGGTMTFESGFILTNGLNIVGPNTGQTYTVWQG